MKNVVIVEKIKTIREGIKILINRFSNFDCDDTFESLNLFNRFVHTLKPNILLVDLEYKDLSVIDNIKKLKRDFPELIIIVLIMNEENEIIFDSLLNGASAYVHKNSPSQKLVKVLEDAANGKMVVNSIIARKTIEYIKTYMRGENYLATELKLLEMVTEGNSLFAISKSVNMNVDEIKVCFRNIYIALFNHNIKTPYYLER